jgi:membrane-associated protein
MIASPLSWIGDVTDKLGDWASNWWFLGLIAAIAILDSVIPILPSETVVILGGVACSTGQAPYPLWAVIACGAGGAFVGDHMAYAIGREFAPWFARRAEVRDKTRRRLDWARRQIASRGGPLLITARFIPGGRTVLTTSSGITRQPLGWFMRWIALAALLWATYSAGLAYAVGKPFEDNHRAAFWVAFGTALAVNVVIEVVRHVRNRGRPESEAGSVPT